MHLVIYFFVFVTVKKELLKEQTNKSIIFFSINL